MNWIAPFETPKSASTIPFDNPRIPSSRASWFNPSAPNRQRCPRGRNEEPTERILVGVRRMRSGRKHPRLDDPDGVGDDRREDACATSISSLLPLPSSSTNVPDPADAIKCCAGESLPLSPPSILALSIVYLLAHQLPPHPPTNRKAHQRKYSPQLLAFPTKFGVKPRYSPLPPSVLAISLNGLHICCNAARVPGRAEVVVTCCFTLRRSRGCMKRVLMIPAPMPQKAWSRA